MEKYSAGLVKKPTFLKETIEVASLFNQGFSALEVKNRLVEENVLKVTPPRRNLEISSAVTVRVSSLTEDQVRLLCTGSIVDKKQLVMLAIMKTERLIREFMAEVYAEKIAMKQMNLTEADVNVFLSHKAQMDEDVAEWRDVTVKKIRQVIKKILKELGFIDMNGKNMTIVIPILSDEFQKTIAGESAEIRRAFIRR